MRHFRINCTLLALSMMVLISHSALADQFYKFKDKSGRIQIQDSIPSEYVKYGYIIVNDRGITVEIVPSEREQRKKLIANKLRRNETAIAEREKAEKKERDERLFHSFSSAEEIRQAGNNKILIVQAQIDTTAKHVEAFVKNLAKLDEHRAAGGDVDEEGVAKLRKSVAQNKAFIERKRQEQNNIREEYLGYIQRYQILSSKQ